MLPVPRGFFMPWRKALEMHNPPAPAIARPRPELLALCGLLHNLPGRAS